MPRAKREQQILRAAATVFAAHGYHGASMDEVARGAGVTKPLVYQYFGTKADLYAELVGESGRQLVAQLRQVLDAPIAEPEERLRAVCQSFFAFVEGHWDLWMLVSRGLLGRDTAPPGVEATVDAVRRELAEQFALELDAAAAAMGLARASREDVEAFGHAVTGASEAMVRWWLEHPEVPAGDVSRRLSRFLLRGLPGIVGCEGPPIAP